MSYVIKDIEKKYWLGIDRVVNSSYEVVTVVEPIYSFRAATKFDTPEECAEIMKEIKEEGNYDIPAYATENVEELEAAAKEKEQEHLEKIRKVAQDKLDKMVEDYKAQGLSTEEIRKKISEEGILVKPDEI